MQSMVVESRGAVTMRFKGDAGQEVDEGLLQAVQAARASVLLVPRTASDQAPCGVDFDVTRMVPLAVYLRDQLDARRTRDLMSQLRMLLRCCIDHRLPLKNMVFDDARAFFDPWTSSVRFAFLPFTGIAPNAVQTRSYLAGLVMRIHPADEGAHELVERYQRYFEANAALDPMGLERYLGELVLDSLGGAQRSVQEDAGEADDDDVPSDRPTGSVGTAPAPVAEEPACAQPAPAQPIPCAARAATPAEPAPDALAQRRAAVPEQGIPGALHTKTSEHAARAQEIAERTRAMAAELQARETTLLDEEPFAAPLASAAVDAAAPAPAEPTVAAPAAPEPAEPAPMAPVPTGQAAAEPVPAAPAPAAAEPAPATSGPVPATAASCHDWDDFDTYVDDGAPLTGVLGDLDGFFVQRDRVAPSASAQPAPAAPVQPVVSAPDASAGRAQSATAGPEQPDQTPSAASSTRFFLIHRRTGRHAEVRGQAFVVGKSKYTDFQVTGTTTVSRRHAVFHVVGDTCTIEDNASLNGTFVDGRRLEPQQRMALVGGERIRLSDEEFTFEVQRSRTESTR